MDKKGFGFGVALALLLVTALLAAYLAMASLGGSGRGKDTAPQQEDYVRQARDAVDAINQAQQALPTP